MDSVRIVYGWCIDSIWLTRQRQKAAVFTKSGRAAGVPLVNYVLANNTSVKRRGSCPSRQLAGGGAGGDFAIVES
jgi:hypothetical protein